MAFYTFKAFYLTTTRTVTVYARCDSNARADAKRLADRALFLVMMRAEAI